MFGNWAHTPRPELAQQYMYLLALCNEVTLEDDKENPGREWMSCFTLPLYSLSTFLCGVASCYCSCWSPSSSPSTTLLWLLYVVWSPLHSGSNPLQPLYLLAIAGFSVSPTYSFFASICVSISALSLHFVIWSSHLPPSLSLFVCLSLQ